jgi:hypothetical protein
MSNTAGTLAVHVLAHASVTFIEENVQGRRHVNKKSRKWSEELK